MVWNAMTDPEKIKVYLFGTKTTTDWQVGSPILFEGEYKGKQYNDKGNVLECVPFEKIKYNYWSGFSGLEDVPENYQMITYSIEKISEGNVKLTWFQEGFASQEGYEHTEKNLFQMLQAIKELVEK